MGNIGSVLKKLNKIGCDYELTNNPEGIKNADKIILPGVGHFDTGINNLHKLDIFNALNIAVLENRIPILGICVGMQLMAAFSEEGQAKGLSWFDSSVVKFSVSDKYKYKIPHTGWNNVGLKKESPIFNGLPSNPRFYFVHSYHFVCNDRKDAVSTTNYSYEFVSAIQKENIYGVQFHPEKSHEVGEKLLSNFVNLV